MKPIKDKIHTLINRSRDLLTELDNEEPSVEILEKTMDDRQECIDELGVLTKDIHINQLSEEVIESLKALFQEFSEVNENIQQNLNRKLMQRRQGLAKATKQRKAEDGYLVLDKPDISYFQHK